jgi:hypothetical protein
MTIIKVMTLSLSHSSLYDLVFVVCLFCPSLQTTQLHSTQTSQVINRNAGQSDVQTGVEQRMFPI